MPRKSNSISMYGKQWGPIDIPNLEKAIQLYEKLNKLAENFADSLSGSDKIMKQINERADIQNQLKKTGIKLSEDEVKNVLNALDAQKQQNEELNKQAETLKRTSSLDSVLSRTGISQSTDRLSINNFGSTVTSAVQQRYIQNRLNENYKYYSKNSVAKNPETITRLTENKTVNDIKGSAGKFNIAANVLQVAANTFSAAIEKLTTLFTRGIDNQYTAYENTFSNLATRTGVTRSQYYTTQAGVPGQLSAIDMYDNVRVSEVQNMWGSLAKSGFSQEDVFARAIDNVVTNKIVPYLDTTSTDLNLLNNRLDGNFIKQIRGINLATQDISGSTLMNEEVLKSMLDAMAPITDNAIQNLAKESTEMSNLMNYLVDEVGMTKDQAMSYATQVYKQQNYGHQIMSSGSTYERVAYNNNLLSGINVYTDPTSAVINNIVSGSNLWGGMAPGYGDTYSGLITSTIADAIGVDASTMASLVKANQAGVTREGLAANSLMSDEEFENYKNKATEELANGNYQTNTERQEITTENAMTALATSKEWMGHYTDLVVAAIKGVGTLLTTWLGGKFLNLLTGGKLGTWLGGMFTSGKATSAAVGTAAGGGSILATLASGVALGAATIAGIGAAVNSGVNKQINQSTGDKLEEFYGTDLEGNTTAAMLSGIGSSDSNLWGNEDSNGFTGFFKTIGGNVASFTNNISTWWSDTADANKKRLNNLKIALDQQSFDEKTKTEYVLAWALLADSVNELSALGMSRDELKSWVESEEGPSVINAMGKIGKAPLYVYQPHDSYDRKIDSISKSYLDVIAEWNYHRQGLDYVPEDNYPALLHQGEAVLTASTANELRTLVDEYRNTNKESISFETIIQNQTSSLISKMDEMLQFMRSTTGVTNTDWRNGFITESMKYVKSTKSFS